MAQPSDGRLLLAAQAGDAVSLGMLLERHRARLHARATAFVGVDAAEDAVHDAFLVALRRIGDVREPEAAGAWLAAVLTNVCRAQLRRPAHPRADPEGADHAAVVDSAAEALERAARRDWVWTALERLPEDQRLALLLRHFSSTSSYEEIAAACGVPVGTVRSRLSAARSRLVDELLRTADLPHVDTARLAAERAETIGDAFARLVGGAGAGALQAVMERDVAFTLADGRERRGVERLAALLESDLRDGVTFHVRRIVPGAEVTIFEAELRNPPDDPGHCPPHVTQIHYHRGGRTQRLVSHYAG